MSLYEFSGASQYDGRICLQENHGDTQNSQVIKGEEDLSRVYQTLSLPSLPREDTNSNNRSVYSEY